jgi:hypothetical protein
VNDRFGYRSPGSCQTASALLGLRSAPVFSSRDSWTGWVSVRPLSGAPTGNGPRTGRKMTGSLRVSGGPKRSFTAVSPYQKLTQVRRGSAYLAVQEPDIRRRAALTAMRPRQSFRRFTGLPDSRSFRLAATGVIAPNRGMPILSNSAVTRQQTPSELTETGFPTR